jgi:photosystem II stability/assembly factor-like uncharacterized protein
VIRGRDIVTLDMLTGETGVGIARTGATRDELVATRDGGTTWRPIGRLPSAVHPTQTYDASMAFASPTRGWVQTSDPATTIFTANGGRSWLQLHTPGSPTSLNLSPDKNGEHPADEPVWITTARCAVPSEPTSLCRTDLLVYRPGRAEPSADHHIPSRLTTHHRHLLGANLLIRSGPSTGIVEEGAEGSPSSLLATSDSGRAWRTLDDPCQGIVPTGLLALAPSRLVLYCQLGGGGGNQGRVRLYTTASAGQVWTLTSEGSIQGRRRGNIGDFQSFDLALAGDHRRLWLLGFVGGVQTSTDGGFHWTNTSIPTGGYDSRLVTAAATSAWLPLPGVALYRTRNGHSWTRLP